MKLLQRISTLFERWQAQNWVVETRRDENGRKEGRQPLDDRQLANILLIGQL